MGNSEQERIDYLTRTIRTMREEVEELEANVEHYQGLADEAERKLMNLKEDIHTIEADIEETKKEYNRARHTIGTDAYRKAYESIGQRRLPTC